MSLLFFPHFPSVSYFQNTLPLLSYRHRCLFSGPSIAAGKRNSPSTSDKNGSAILWFKHDLRIDDHPGLHAASEFSALVPLYVFDHRILSRFSNEMLEVVLVAVEDLRKSLREHGSDLVIRFGRAEVVIPELVNEVEATIVFAEEEVEYYLCELMDIVNETLERLSCLGGNQNLALWRTPFHDIEVFKDLPTSYDDFMRINCPLTSPLPLPTFPALKPELNWGSLPTDADLKEFMNRSLYNEDLELIKEASAETVLHSKFVKQGGKDHSSSSLKRTQTKRKANFLTRKGNILGGGTGAILNALDGYLRYSEGTARDDWQVIHEMVRSTENRDGASFVKLFRASLCLGVVSRRRVHYEAIKYERERNAGFLSPFGYSATAVAAAVDAVCSMEWYWLTALKGRRSNCGTLSTRIWRWNGFLIQYAVFGREGPAILLVHGFGAFLEHYRDNIYGIAEGGNQVWAITILGFGRSEKPNIIYTELLWAEMLKDFIVEVVAGPVHLVGNSIGGYIISIVAGFWPALTKSIILMNSAGIVVPRYSFLPFKKERKVSGVSWLGARLLLFYLRLAIKDVLKSCYPTRTERADDWLISEMLRASYDPGVLAVLESIFSFNLSIPLNYLLKGFEEKVLVIQGMRDPIYDSKSMLIMLKDHCAGIVIKELDAGHCPHDEQPEEVNCIIREWVLHVESKKLWERNSLSGKFRPARKA